MIICYGNNKFRYYMYIYYVKKHFDMKKLLFVYVVLYLTCILCSLLFSYILFGKNAEIKSNQDILLVL